MFYTHDCLLHLPYISYAPRQRITRVDMLYVVGPTRRTFDEYNREFYGYINLDFIKHNGPLLAIMGLE